MAIWDLLGGGIGAIANWFGGQANRDAQQNANLMNYQMGQQQLAQQAAQWAQAYNFNADTWQRSFDDQREARGQSMAAANQARLDNIAINNQNIALQREFAQNGISWRVQDAARSGLHPLAALGGTGASFSPIASVGGGSSYSSSASPGSMSAPGGGSLPTVSADTSFGNALGAMGQDISRAISKGMNASDNSDAFTAASQVQQLEKGKLENELLRSQIARLRQTSSPPMPVGQRYLVEGQGNAPGGSSTVTLVQDKALERTPSDPRNTHAEPAAIVDVGYARTPTGWATVPSKDVKERIEDNLIYEAQHFIRNNIAPMFSNKYFKPPGFAPAQGHHWAHNPITGEYHQVPTKFQQRFTGRR